MEQPFINDTCILQKFTGKGAWTFISFPPIDDLPKKSYGTVKIRGFIDDYELKNTTMWAMKKGIFLPVKAEIRKQIKKEEGDTVKVILFLDEPGQVREDDLIVCLKEEPTLYKRFKALPAAKKKEITDWIFSAKTEDMKIQRIGETMEKLEESKVKSRKS